MVEGRVRLWHGDEGWGVVDSASTPGGCWTHFGVVEMAGYRELTAGETVELEWEPADQDGYSYRATRVRPHSARPGEWIDHEAAADGAVLQSVMKLEGDKPDPK